MANEQVNETPKEQTQSTTTASPVVVDAAAVSVEAASPSVTTSDSLAPAAAAETTISLFLSHTRQQRRGEWPSPVYTSPTVCRCIGIAPTSLHLPILRHRPLQTYSSPVPPTHTPHTPTRRPRQNNPPNPYPLPIPLTHTPHPYPSPIPLTHTPP